MKSIKRAPNGLNLPVQWRDEQWTTSIEVLPPHRSERRALSLSAPTLDSSRAACASWFSRRPNRRGFTLIELLVVIAIIGILAGLLLPVLAGVKNNAKKKMAKLETVNIASWVTAYEGDYTVAPVEPNTVKNVAMNKDYTFINGNQEPITILSDFETNNPAINVNHARNPQRHAYASGAKHSPGITSPGIGSDFVFRDPWGYPYVISFDLDYDNQVEDTVYGKVPGSVLVWSVGPDGLYTKPAAGQFPDTLTNNKDNILSWR